MRRHTPVIGWPPKELIWLKAALTLPPFEFLEACEDIAGMSDRKVSAIASKARALRGEWRPGSLGCHRHDKALRVASPEPWEMVQPTKAQIMAGRAPTRRHKP